MVKKAIPYTRHNFDEQEFGAKFDQFWQYFETVWLKQYDPKCWNANHVIKGD
jgi:hypothetical protein